MNIHHRNQLACRRRTAATRPGPTLTFIPNLGGLKAHITDGSGVASQCACTMDYRHHSFRDRNVTIKCDNGTGTPTSAKF